MKQLTIAGIKAAFAAKGYAWNENSINIIGIRTTLTLPDVFNDLFVVVFKQPTFAPDATLVAKQKFLNYWGFRDKTGKSLHEDGIDGENTQYALAQLKACVGKERLLAWTGTTTPGVYYLRNPVPGGCAVVVPGQYKGIYQVGFHQGRKDHPALVQQGGEISVYRDADRDDYAEETKVISTGYFGINIHHANPEATSTRIWNWSAGCQVFANPFDHAQFMRICGYYKLVNKNKFTYTLLREKELI